MPEDKSFEIDLRTGAGPGSESGSTLDARSRAHARGTTGPAGRFPPGTLIGGRYRMIGLLGRGGMGEVYRAEDLRLGEDVALKFLAPSLAGNPARRARFVAEAKVARKLTHANLCRVHDFVEADGECFLSMEYVEGEDLASLLKRVGRLDPDKALDVAQQLCLGLAAAHERGVLHRDLKPANVMLDVRGRVRLMDFGLAALANEIAAEDALAGTPRYMAPEQLQGGEITVRSDLYALGLVLHEIFAGAYPAPYDATQTALSSLHPDVDPQVMRTIAICLDPDPSRRPSNAIAVAASLPGGDPLAAAVRAGELPSPAMVAAAATPEVVSRRVAGALVACAILGLALVATFSVAANPFLGREWTRAPEALVDRAKDVVRSLGYSDAAAHEAAGIAVDDAYLAELRRTRQGARRWDPIGEPRPAAAAVWWRSGPRSLGTFGADYTTTQDEPPPSDGDVSARMSMAGDLLAFQARAGGAHVPPPLAPDALDRTWTDLFARAGLDRARFREIDPGPAPAAAHDARRAWGGPPPEGGRPIRVEGATLRGAVVSFEVVEPWHAARVPATAPARPALLVAEDVVQLVAFAAFLAGAARNLRRRRGDLRAATRFGVFLAICGTLFWLCRTSDVAGGSGAFWSVMHGVGQALFGGVFGAAMYLAIEPFVRRRLPHMLVGSARVFQGRLGDPLVGRDLLAGAAGALAVEVLVAAVYGLGALGVELSSPPRRLYDTLGLYGLKDGLAELIWCVRLGATNAVLLSGVFAAIYATFKRRDLALGVMILLGGVLFAKHWVFESMPLQILFGALTAAIGSFILVRLGLLAAVVFGIVSYANRAIPVTFDLDAWYARAAVAYVVGFLALLAWGWRAATARPRSTATPPSGTA
jgi:serine/threonine-protein kinase